jgi:RimJ/RimL family protein N-acetyltransferase
MSAEELSGEGLHLRCYQPGDTPAVHAAAVESVAEVAPYETWCHEGYTLKEAAEYVEGWVQSWEARQAYYFAVLDQATELYLGSCGLCPVEHQHRTAGLGFWVRTSETGRGVATAAARLVVAFGFTQLGMHRIELMVAVHNAASRRVADKLGAAYEGTLRHRLVLQGQPTDMAMYALVGQG